METKKLNISDVSGSTRLKLKKEWKTLEARR
jgi:hypothetical protein